jgi:hypothetical protein
VRLVTGLDHASNLNPLVYEVLQLTLSTSANALVVTWTMRTA